MVVAEYSGDPLNTKQDLSTEEIIKISFQCLLGLQHMNELDLVHRHLSPDNILIKKNGDVQLYNYGLYYMTDGGKNVSFPIGYLQIFLFSNDSWNEFIYLRKSHIRFYFQFSKVHSTRSIFES